VLGSCLCYFSRIRTNPRGGKLGLNKLSADAGRNQNVNVTLFVHISSSDAAMD